MPWRSGCVDHFDGELLRKHFGITGHPVVFYPALLAVCPTDQGEFAQMECAPGSSRRSDVHRLRSFSVHGGLRVSRP
jgi:hypothetical protein